MKRTYDLENLDCAICANKIEKAIEELDDVIYVDVNFIMQKLTLEIEDSKFDIVLKKIEKLIKKVEPDCSLLK